MKNVFILLLIITTTLSCDKKEPCVSPGSSIETLNYEITSTTSLSEDDAILNELLTIIKSLSESETCSDASNWEHTPYGSKACGGPIGHIAYSKCINTADFFNKITVYTELQDQYNSKHGVVSTCDVPPAPSSIICENDQPKLIY